MNARQTLAVETITPAMATEMLRLNTNNRPVRQHVVRRYAADMQRPDGWMLTGEPIIINGTDLLNGQHRLHACVAANAPFTTAVFRGAASDVFAVVDSGLPRQPGDVLRHDGHHNFNVIAAACRLVLSFRANLFGDTQAMSIASARQHVQEEANAKREVYAELSSIGVGARREGFNPSGMTAFGVVLGEHLGSHAHAVEWTQSIIKGVGMEDGDPRLAFRRWVLASRHATNVVHLSALIRTRNAYAKSQTRTLVRPWFAGTQFPRFEEPVGS